MNNFRKIRAIVYNKYFIASAIFVVYVLVFDSNNLATQIRLKRELSKLQAEKQYYLNEIKKDKEAIRVLMTNERNLEKFAREKYLMKRENEDVYLIIREGKRQPK